MKLENKTASREACMRKACFYQFCSQSKAWRQWGALQKPLEVCTLHLHHGELGIPGERSNYKAARQFLEKTITTNNQ